MGEEKRMSRRTAHRLALHYAINERDSYADAWRAGSPERQRAEWQAAEFRRVLKEEFGQITAEDHFAAQNYPSLNIEDIP